MTVERFWSLDEGEVLIEIEGYQRRTEDLDELLSHYTARLLDPHRKKGRPPIDSTKLRLFKKRESEPDEDTERDLVEERRAYLTEHLARVGAPV